MKALGKTQWLVGGAVVVLAATATLILGRVPSPLTPMPLYQVVLAWTTGYGFLVALPILYALTLALLWDRKRIGETVLVLSLVMAMLSGIWLVSSWNYGERYQGPRHTLLVAMENVISFGFVIALAIAGVRQRSRQMQVAAYLTLFVVLSWCAFPYLGEMP